VMTVLRFFARYGYVPFMLLGLNLAAVYLVSAHYSYLWIGLLFCVAVGLSLLMEWALPYEPEWNETHADAGKDIAHGVAYELANIIALLLLPLITLINPLKGIWPSSLPLAVQLLLAIVVADFGMTMIHYWSHRLPLLWRLHAIHHGVHRLYGFNGLVRHPLHQTLDLAFGTLPLVLVGLPMRVAVLLAFAISIQLLVQHTNVDCELGPLQRFIAVGPVHRLHHVNWAGEGDVNFGLFFTLWDDLLGTLRLASPRAPVAGDIGIQDRPDFPQVYLRQLVMPFVSGEEETAFADEASDAAVNPATARAKL
jgi:sterol desaturase/sphingolipid hydroxylase (fatty acid hydroxylase superfamily)